MRSRLPITLLSAGALLLAAPLFAAQISGAYLETRRVQTRSLGDKDHLCGNEVTYYPPLTGQLSHAMPVYTVSDEYQGGALGLQWKLYGKRSAFVGTFER